jgi:hypothetical protein
MFVHVSCACEDVVMLYLRDDAGALAELDGLGVREGRRRGERQPRHAPREDLLRDERLTRHVQVRA